MKIYILTHDNTEQYKGSEDGCFIELQKRQPHSSSHALKFEGWKVTAHEVTAEEGNAILERDRYSKIIAELLEPLNFLTGNRWIKIKFEDGTTGKGDRNAMNYSDSRPGAKVQIMRGYITKE